MKIAFIVNRTEHASVYYRTLQYVPLFANEGAIPSVLTLPKGFNSRISLFSSLRNYDIVIVQRKLFNLLNFLPLRRLAKKLVYDLDDALFVKDSKSTKSFSLTRKLRFARTAKQVDGVICGNRWIQERTAPLNINHCIIPTAVDTDLYNPVKIHTQGEAFTAVWIGGKSTLFYLEGILPTLEAAAQRIPGFRLRVISDFFPSSKTLYIEKIPWTRKAEVQALRECDVGLMPLVDDPWSRGKCGLKLLQYGAVGLPSICSPIGVNPLIVHHGESGFHAQTPADWQEALISLSQDLGVRSVMGQKARQIVEDQFSVKACFPRLLDFLRRTALT
ncbi:MAG: glycosyltransferase family 4 protein [Planctomycetota bacterium]